MISAVDYKLNGEYLHSHPYLQGYYANHLLRVSTFNRYLVDPVLPLEKLYYMLYLILNCTSYGN